MSLELALALHRIGRPRILVVGDFILDREVHCEPVRFAQEAAHCPVWKEGWTYEHPGGAGAVELMCKGLGADTFFASIGTGTTKTRYFIGDTQVLRVDQDALPIPAADTNRIAADISSLFPAIWQQDDAVSAVLIADYGKGVCTDAVLRAAIDGAAKRGIPCIVDPAHGADWKRYAGATCIKCNQHEWEANKSCGHTESIIVVTEGALGLWMSDSGDYRKHFEPVPRHVVDATGAGDMVLAALGVCIAGSYTGPCRCGNSGEPWCRVCNSDGSSGMSWPDACRVANAAAGLKCERRGAVPVPRAEIIADLLTDTKVIPQELLPAVAQNRKVVWSNGAFDRLHRGHLHLLAEAKKHGNLLIVGVNSDASVSSRKGAGRPLQTCSDRCAMLAALACVDYVVEFDTQADLAACVEAVKPAVIVIGDDYRGRKVVGSEFAGSVHFVEKLPGYSTTELLR